VSFDASGNGIVDYTVDGATVFESAKVESRSDAEARGATGVGVDIGVGGEGGIDLSSVANLQGAAVANVNAQASASANVEFESSAEFEAHDNGNGVAVLKSGGEEQILELGVSSSAETETAQESAVTFTTEDTESSLIVAGEGEVGTNEQGNVTAHLESGTNAVVRAYGEEKTENEEQQERIIAEGKAAAEVQFTEEGGEVAGDSAEFLSDTEVETEVDSGNSVSLAVDRTESEGKVVMTTVNDAAVGTTESLSVNVDGEAAAEAESYSELEAGIQQEPKYLVVDGEAESQAQVLVAVDSFSEREITVEGEESGTEDGTEQGETDDETEDTTEDDSMENGETENTTENGGMEDGETDGGEESSGEGMPGFTAVIALFVALATAVVVGIRRD